MFSDGLSEIETHVFLMLLFAYGLQALLTELAGVKIDASGVSFPNCAFPQFPYLVLLRRKLPEGSFDRIDLIAKQSLEIHSAGRRITVRMVTRYNRIDFASRLRRTFPKVSVTILY
jgi:hypothetical protein